MHDLLQTYVPERLYPFVKSFWRLEVARMEEGCYAGGYYS